MLCRLIMFFFLNCIVENIQVTNCHKYLPCMLTSPALCNAVPMNMLFEQHPP